jgi:hypothetical protein
MALPVWYTMLGPALAHEYRSAYAQSHKNYQHDVEHPQSKHVFSVSSVLESVKLALQGSDQILKLCKEPIDFRLALRCDVDMRRLVLFLIIAQVPIFMTAVVWTEIDQSTIFGRFKRYASPEVNQDFRLKCEPE